jgi:protein-tyrosine-phosphatase
MPRRIVFVCTGNTCRSPLAEVLARARYADLPLIFASAGTDAVAGQPASAETRAIARERGLDLEAHRSAPVDARAVADAAWVIGMTRMHTAVLSARLSPEWPGRVGLLRAPGLDWRNERVPSVAIADRDIADQDITDPWHHDLATYRRTGEQIDAGLAAWAEVFRELCP